MSKKSLSYLVFKSKEPLYVNDANINRLFNIDLECDGVFGSIDTRCVLSVPVIASSTNNPGNQDSGPQFSKSLAHRKHTLQLEKQQRVVGVLQAFNKRLRQNTGLHADDVIAQAHAASFDKVDGDIMGVCCNMLRGHIKRVEALLLIERQFSYLDKLAGLTVDSLRSYLPPIPSIEDIDPIKLARSIENKVQKMLHVSKVRLFVVGSPPGYPAAHPISGRLGSQRLEQALRSREQIKLLSKAMHMKNEKDSKRQEALGISTPYGIKSQNPLYRRRLKQHKNLGVLLKVWHVRKELDYNMQMSEQRKYTDLFSGICGQVLETRKYLM